MTDKWASPWYEEYEKLIDVTDHCPICQGTNLWVCSMGALQCVQCGYLDSETLKGNITDEVVQKSKQHKEIMCRIGILKNQEKPLLKEGEN